ncbi:MAG: glycosyltransferase [Nitrososphaerota archaeon]
MSERRRGTFTLDDITVVTTSFLRFDLLLQLIHSVRRFYPTLPILIADQSGDYAACKIVESIKKIPNVKWIDVPFDSGLAKTRNIAVENVETPLLFLLDDDSLLTEESKIENLLDVYNFDHTVCMVYSMSSRSRHVHRLWSTLNVYIDKGEFKFIKTHTFPLTTNAGTRYFYSNMGLNVFLTDKDFLLENKWDEDDVIASEHLEQILRFYYKQYRVATVPSCIVSSHIRNSTYGDAFGYSTFRTRKRPWDLKAAKFGLKATKNEKLDGIPCFSPTWAHPDTPAATNIVITNLVKSGSTMLTRFFQALGWHLVFEDDSESCREYAEPRLIFDLKNHMRKIGISPEKKAEIIKRLEEQPKPFVWKDPKLVTDFDIEQWLEIFAPYRPQLIVLRRPLERIMASIHKAGWNPAEEVRKADFDRLQQIFELWPWKKCFVEWEDVVEIATAS